MPSPTRISRFRPQRQDIAYEYDGQTVMYSLWSTNDLSHNINTVIFLGTVQIGKLPAWIAQHCPMGTVVVQGAPHWLAKEDGSNISEFMHRFTEDVFIHILSTYHVKKLRVIADSQAVPGVLGLLATTDDYAIVHHVVLIQPLGLNASIFTGTASDRIALFKKRVAKNFRYQLRSLVSDRRLLYNHGQILKTVGYNTAKSNAQYNSGLSHDATNDLKKLYTAHIQIVIVSGQNDKMFPPQEIQSTLNANRLNIPFVVVPGVPHSPLASRQGMKLLDRALAY